MAGRPTKQGLEYFPLDVDFFNDEKVEFVSARFGVKGEIISIRLLCKIYRNGYYTAWDEDESTLLAKRAGDGITPSLVREIVNELVRRRFFNESLLNSFGILSSTAIQKRYVRATNERKEIEINKDFWLIDIPKNAVIINNQEENPINRPINPDNPPDNPQSKVKESKVNIYPYQDIVELWNSTCSHFSKVLKVTDARKNKIRIRMEEFGGDLEQQLAVVNKLFEKAQASKFMRGDNKTGWRASFDWLFENSKNWVKVLEGNYDNEKPPAGKGEGKPTGESDRNYDEQF